MDVGTPPPRSSPSASIGGVELSVVHDGFTPGSTVAGMVSHGWPTVVASLKSLLETVEPLAAG